MKVTILIPTMRERREKINKCVDKIVANTNYNPYEILLNIEPDKDWSEKIVTMTKGVKNGLVVFFADDIEVEGNWLTNAVKMYQESFKDGHGLLAFNDGIQYGKWATHGLTSPEFLLKWWYHGYIHFHVDVEISDVAKRLDKYIYCEDAKAIHVHPCVGKAPLDEIYRKNIDGPLQHDKDLYAQRKKLSNDYKDLDKLEWS